MAISLAASLIERAVETGRDGRIQSIIAHVPHHADNLPVDAEEVACRCPTSRPGKYCFANDSLTMTTRLVLSVSASVKKRPRSKGVRKTWKNSGLTEANSAERCFWAESDWSGSENAVWIPGIIHQGDAVVASHGGFFNTRQSPHLAQYLPAQTGYRRRCQIAVHRRIVRNRNPDASHHQAIRIETGIHSERIPKAMHQKSRAAQQHHRQGDLGGHQSAPKTILPQAGSAAPARPPSDRDWDRCAEACSAGVKPNRIPVSEREHTGQAHHSGIEVYFGETRQIGRHQREQRSFG